MYQFDLLLKILFRAMFDNKDVVFKGKKFPLTKKNGLRRYDIGNLLFIEQDLKKKTEWAKRARKGIKIMWVIDIKYNRYLARVENENIIRLQSPSNNEK